MDERQRLVRELDASDDILHQLLEEVGQQQGTLSNKTYDSLDAPGIIPSPDSVPERPVESPEQVLLGLRESTVTFGNPKNNLTRLTPELFDALHIPLNKIWREQMHSSFDFYYMTMPAILNLRHGIQLRTLRCRLDFESGLADGIIIQRLFPTSAWKEILNIGGSVQVALDGQLDWQFGLSSTALQALLQLPLPGEVQAHVKNSNELKAHIAIPDFTWRVGRVDISAAGESGTYCDWELRRADVRLSQTIDFGIVFKVPSNVERVTLNGIVAARPSRNWLIEGLRSIFAYLSPQLQDELRQHENSSDPHLLLKDSSIWPLALPR